MPESLYATPKIVTDLEQCCFYHTLEIPDVGVVDGIYDLRESFDDYVGPISFDGLRVLEIGPGSGFLTFEMEKRGAEVVSIELSNDVAWDYVPFNPFDSPLLADWIAEQRIVLEKTQNGYWFAHRHFDSKAKVHYGSASDIPEELGHFDCSIMASVLLHNRDPLRIISNCAQVTKNTLVIIDQHDRELEEPGMPLLRFIPTRENGLAGTWWHLSHAFLKQYLRCLGFVEVSFSVTTLHHTPVPGGPTNALDSFSLVAQRSSTPPPADR